jgi:curved DNA-binding protein CbpA
MPGQPPRRDHYAVLGVPRSASARQITLAYRGLVRSLHPDVRPQDPAAAENLADVLDAYDTLRDPGRRAAYDAGRRGRAVPVRVTRRTPTSPVTPAPARQGPLFSVSVRIGPRFGVPPAGWGHRGPLTVARLLRQWLGQPDGWPR